MSEKERSHLMEWIILIDEVSRSSLIILNDDELEKKYMLSVKKVSVELNDFF
ncbi:MULTISPECIES: BH0509 family protein [Bacillus cereus group]|uniref:BH0509 family protein n=1 Tax=Bacillus thuringiensis serovar toumanoffi TaxID=180862 RepID=A0ABD5IB11_BACTU|nr:BH0509 family protein [Bacillus thuringiensis]EEM93148.1 hypothetical protein bthur0013_54970 [Bacillus thuringiensis IBL 200]MCR6784318.1 BH0509 family protein [Bacillus thuringiensis]MCR6863148.1 BH0509 family protein [Bacillus thuringiensis]MCR6869243.1 BH0509 family protein [Bacillus thuringiensis]MDW9214010.1 BH0509 family protein [Bacillus thuringiensis serovar toumanoffi]